MSVEIALFPPLSDELIENDNLIKVENIEEDDNKYWLSFNDEIIFRLYDGFLNRKLPIETIRKFVTHLWTNYKILTAFDGSGTLGDSAHLLTMEYCTQYDNAIDIIVNDKELYDILAIEYYSKDTKKLLPNNLKDEVEEYRLLNYPLFLEAIKYKKQ